MPYLFVGFFARPAVPRPGAMPEGAVWRDILAPFNGVGVWLPASFEDEEGMSLLTPAEAQARASALGIAAADHWIYLYYFCWGGDIDFVYGLGSRGGVPFGPVRESEPGKVEAAYVGLMEEFGVSEADALYFEPFVRGFWGVD